MNDKTLLRGFLLVGSGVIIGLVCPRVSAEDKLTSLEIVDEDGHPSIVLTGKRQGRDAQIVIYDSKHTSRVSIGLTDGEPTITLNDKAGEARVLLGKGRRGSDPTFIEVIGENGMSAALTVDAEHSRVGALSGWVGGGRAELSSDRTGAALDVGRQGGAIGSSTGTSTVTAVNRASVVWQRLGTAGLRLNDSDGIEAASLRADEGGKTELSILRPK